ncbi:MAG TPA: TonB-dependent receptor [Thermoanaerobaculia bacterium]|nr:TonB-dependent receptor [Thermoanaerobaculia bacterium]
MSTRARVLQTATLSTAFALLVMLLLPLRAAAQSQAAGGGIAGTVASEAGALPGATVTVRNTATGLSREAVADGAGRYLVPLLPVGPYEVSAALQGFAPAKKSVELHVGETVEVDLELQVTLSEELSVVAEAPVLEGSRTQQASTVGEQAVANLPTNGRNFIDFVLTTPGVTKDVLLGDISFAGQRGTLNSLVVDGADDNNTFFGQALGRTGSGRAPYQFSQDAVQEFQVNRNAYSAEYGRAGGAVINVVTKSGTNDYDGSLFWFYRDKDLNANSFANKTAVPPRPKSPYHYDQFGGSLGGPIQRDRLFFFVNYDGQRNEVPNVVNVDQNLAGLTLPTDPDTQAGLATLRSKGNSYPRRQDQDVFLGKLDWNLSESHRASLRYNDQDFTGVNFENGGATNAEEHTGNSLVNTRTLNVTLSSVLSGALFNDARAQYAKDQEPGEANSPLPEATVRQSGRTILTVGRNFFSPRETTIERWQLADTLIWARGLHTLKGGFDVNNDKILNFFPGNFNGAYTFNSIAAFNRGTPDAAGERYVQAFAGPGTSGATTKPNIFETALFVQDDWDLRPNVKLSLGLRYDRQKFDQPKVRNPDAQLAAAGIDTSFLNIDDDNFAPRLGFAWTASDRLVVRAGYGLFYGRTPAIMVGTAHSNNGINVQTLTFTGSAAPRFPFVFGSIPSGGTAAKPTIFVFDRDYENPEVHQASAGADYRLSKDIAVGASYLYVRGKKLQRSTDINLFAPVPTAIPVQGGGTVTIDRFPSTRPFTNFDRIIEFQSSAESEYNGLTLELRKRFDGRLLYNVAYTLGKVEDTTPDATAVVPNGTDDAKFPSNPFDFDDDRAPGNNDQKHRIVVSGLWDLSYWQESAGVRRALLDGWSLSWIATWQTGQPYSKTVTNDLNRDGNTRNDIVPGSRNSQRLPDYLNVDLRVAKRIPLWREVDLELIAEAFNLFDRDNIVGQRNVFYNFDVANTVLIPQTNFGQDLTAADNRIVQLAAKITF